MVRNLKYINTKKYIINKMIYNNNIKNITEQQRLQSGLCCIFILYTFIFFRNILFPEWKLGYILGDVLFYLW